MAGVLGSPTDWSRRWSAPRDCAHVVRDAQQPQATKGEITGQLALATEEETVVAADVRCCRRTAGSG